MNTKLNPLYLFGAGAALLWIGNTLAGGFSGATTSADVVGIALALFGDFLLIYGVVNTVAFIRRAIRKKRQPEPTKNG